MGRGRSKETTSADTGDSKPKRVRRTKAELVDEVIRKIEEKIEGGDVKATVGDLIRLLQMEEELEQEQPKEIKVTWVDPAEASDATEK